MRKTSMALHLRWLCSNTFLNRSLRFIASSAMNKACATQLYGVSILPNSKEGVIKPCQTLHVTSPSLLALRNFSSKTEVEGPVAVDYSALLPEEEFHTLADDLLDNLQGKLEDYGDNLQVDGFDLDYASGVLTVKLGSLGTYVINKQTPNRQIWLSSPISWSNTLQWGDLPNAASTPWVFKKLFNNGPARFDWDKEKQVWTYRRTKANLLQLLETEFSSLLKSNVTLM